MRILPESFDILLERGLNCTDETAAWLFFGADFTVGLLFDRVFEGAVLVLAGMNITNPEEIYKGYVKNESI